MACAARHAPRDVGTVWRINVEQPVLATLADGFGAAATQTLAIDTTVNHDVRHMDSGRPEFARDALGDHAQSGLGGGKLRVSALAP